MNNVPCKTGVQDQISLGQPIFEFKTIAVPAALNQIATDILVRFSKPYLFFMICSITSAVSDSMFAIAFVPANYQNTGGSAQIQPTGGEQWIPFSNRNNSTGRAEGRFIKFRTPVQQFYLTADHPSQNPATGNQYFVTILATNDIDYVIAERT